MAGITDAPFRRMALRYGVGLAVSEMVASAALMEGKPEMVLKAEGEGVGLHAVQLAGRLAHVDHVDHQHIDHKIRLCQVDVVGINATIAM